MSRKKQPPTISDGAQLAGVSITTLSWMINGNARVVPETAVGMRVAITQLRFVPRPAHAILGFHVPRDRVEKQFGADHASRSGD